MGFTLQNGFRLAAACAAFGLMATANGQTPAAAPVLPPAIKLPVAPPKGAIVLVSKDPASVGAAWYKRYSTEPGHWKQSPEGAFLAVGGDITSREEFGDCYLHVEFRPTVDAAGKVRGHGNSGVGLQGRYEIQIMNSFGEPLEAHGCASLYGQKAATSNACLKGGVWQSYDIFFRAPRLDDAGKVLEQPRVTVIQNGIVVQNNAEFVGPTGIQYGEFKGQTATGPLVLQGDHDPVEYRNTWVVKL